MGLKGGSKMRRLITAIGALVLAASGAWAQNVVSAKAGLVHLVEGDAFLNDQKLQPKITEFPDIKEGNVLKTAEGRVEVLLSPGSFLRLGEDSSFQMISTRLSDVRLEVTKGSAIVEVAELLKDNGITVVLKDATVVLKKPGLYRFDESPYRIQVYDGEAQAQSGDKFFTLKDGKMLALNGSTWVATRFDKEDGDALYRWAKRRSSYIAMANVSAARQARTAGNSCASGYGFGYVPASWNGGCWYFNPYYGLYTFIPLRGMLYSPFGWAFWSPYTVERAYYPVYYGGGGGGHSTGAASGHYDSNLGYMTSGARTAGAGYSGGYSGGSSGVASGVSSGGSVGASAPSAGAAGGARGGATSGGSGGGSGGGGRGGH